MNPKITIAVFALPGAFAFAAIVGILSNPLFMPAPASQNIAHAQAADTPTPIPTPEQPDEAGAERSASVDLPSNYAESPDLAAQVAAGELPPVGARIPSQPMIIPTLGDIGQYGGTLRRFYLGPADGCNFLRLSRASLVRFSTDGFSFIPSVARDWEVSDDGTEWTFFLREGMKWSDGTPFTADDFVWQYENVITNEELSPTPPFFLKVGTRVGKMYKVDATTVKFAFPVPNFLFLELAAQADEACYGNNSWRNVPWAPAHYMQQFHIDFNPDANALAEQEGYDHWTQLFDIRGMVNDNPDKPVITPWKFTNRLGDPVVFAERNPYFWAVDPAGNQLPYLDGIQLTLVENTELGTLRAFRGEIDMQGRHIRLDQFPVLKEGEGQGDYTVLTWPTFAGSDVSFFFNMSLPGPSGDAIRTKEFRQALSLAIDRSLIHQVQFLGFGQIRQGVPGPEHPHYPGDDVAQLRTEYDPDAANALLDEVFPNKDSEGFRMNGEDTIVLDITVTDAFRIWPDAAEQVGRAWEAVGVKTNVNSTTRATHFARWQENKWGVMVWNEDTAGFTFSSIGKRSPEGAGSFHGPGCALWLDTGGREGNPDAEGYPCTEESLALLDMHKRGPGLPEIERNALGKQIYKTIVENQYNIGIVGLSPMVQGVIVVKNGLNNVPETAGNDWPLRTPNTGFPEQWHYGAGTQAPPSALVLYGPSSLSVSEAALPGTLLATYTATGTDAASQPILTFLFGLEGSDSRKYRIDSGTGELYTAQWLDYDTDTADTVTVVVSDGTRRETLDVTINVEDEGESDRISDVSKANPVLGTHGNPGHALDIHPKRFVETKWANWGAILRIEVTSDSPDAACGTGADCVKVSLRAADSGDEQELIAMRSSARGDLFITAVKLVESEAADGETETIIGADGTPRQVELLQVEEEDEVLIKFGGLRSSVGVENEAPEFIYFEPAHGSVVDDRDVDFQFVVLDAISSIPEPEDLPDYDGDDEYIPVVAVVHDSQCYNSTQVDDALAAVTDLNLHEGAIHCDGQPELRLIVNDRDFDELDDGYEVDTTLVLSENATHYVSFIACDNAGNCAAYDPDESGSIAMVQVSVAETLSDDFCLKSITKDIIISANWNERCLSEKQALSGSGDRYARFFAFSLPVESDIAVELYSDEESYLYLHRGTGTSSEILVETYDYGSSIPAVSSIRKTLAPGEYTIEATTYASGVSGEFFLIVKGFPTVQRVERAVLTALYNATNGDNWNHKENWLTDAPLSKWFGVIADDHGRVIVFKLDRNGLSGEIPPELSLLDRLKALDLSYNRLTGVIPLGLKEMDNLVYLDLGDNKLTGEVPLALTRLRYLEELDLGNNRLTGEIPPELARLGNLEGLGLGGNLLTGSIPPELVGLVRLKALDLSDNDLTGSIPVLLSYLPNLGYLELENNRLNGDIPYELGNLVYLSILTLSGNELGGCVPESLREVGENDFAELGLPFCEGAPSLQDAVPISDTFGTFAEPVPLGTAGLAPNGMAVEISSPILDATEVVEKWEGWVYSDRESPAPGNKHIVAHARIENVSGSGYQYLVSQHDFGVVRASGQVAGRNCELRLGEISVWLDKSESISGILCFEIPEDEEFPKFYYSPEPRDFGELYDILGFWALSEEAAGREVERGTPISDSFGTREIPVPLGTKALAADGYAVTVLSVDLDAEDMVEDWHIDADLYLEYKPPAPGNRYVVIRARAENIEGSDNPKYSTSNGFLNIVTSSGKLIRNARKPCLVAPENLGAINTFEGGLQEGYVCFEIPIEEFGFTLFYENGYQPREVLGFWAVSDDPAPIIGYDPATPISGNYGTRANPVPLGEKALASDGIALTVISAVLDATELLTEDDPENSEHEYGVLIKPGSFGRPAPGNKYVIALVRVEGAALNENEIQYLRKDNFGLVTASGLIMNEGTRRSCDGSYAGGPYIHVFNGVNADAALCYEVPIESSGLNIYYTPRDSDEVLGFWAMSEDGTTPARIEPAKPISYSYGSIANPVPTGERAATSDGLAIGVVSYMLDFSEVGAYPLERGRKTVVVRARIEDVGGEENTLRTIRGDSFGIAGQSGTIDPEYTYHRCSVNSSIWDMRLYGRTFGGGWQEGLLCFRIPVDETAVSIFYKPENSERPIGYWEVTAPEPPTGATLISEEYGTLANPVPIGEGALSANGVGITVLSVTPDADEIVAEEAGSEEYAPAPGNRYMIVEVRAENTTGFDEGIVLLWPQEFGIVTSSGLVIPYNLHDASRCDEVPDRIKERFLGDRTLEGNFCFQVPADEVLYAIFYAPRHLDRVFGIWNVSEGVSPPVERDAGTVVSDDYGTRSRPVPIGEKAVTSDGTAITFISVDTDPGDSIVPWTDHHHPPEEGVGYILIRARIENDELADGSLLRLHRDDFGIVSSSGLVIFRDRRYGWNPGCESNSREIHESVVLRGGFAEGDLCFKVPSEESGWTLFYSPGEASVEQDFWALTDEEPAEPVPAEPPESISETYGSWSSPVPLGESARASNGIAVTLLDILDQDEFMESIMEATEDYYPLPLDGQKYVAARVRIENFADSENELLTITHDDFGVLLSPGKFVQAAYHPCGTQVNYDIIYFHDAPGILETANFFRGGQFEGHLCFPVPLDETARSMFYRPGWSFEPWPGGDEPALGFWAVLEEDTEPEPSEPGAPISDTYGTRVDPVSPGEKAVASNGLAITVVSAELDATDTVEEERAYNDPPDEGNKYVIVRVRVENATGNINETLSVITTDFGVETPSERIREPDMCGVVPDTLRLRLFGGMSNEGNLCFEMPSDERALTLFYQPGQSVVYDERVRDFVYQPPDTEVLGYWAVPAE